MPDLEIAPLSSLNFSRNWKLPFQIQVCYIQKFVTEDRIRVQYTASDAINVRAVLHDRTTGQDTPLTPSTVTSENGEKANELLLDDIPAGCYQLQLWGNPVEEVMLAASDFDVLAEEPDGFVRIAYNHYRDEFGTLFSAERTFDFRVEGCFLPSEMSAEADTEGFRDQRSDYHQLSAVPFVKQTLSVGGGFGVPNWVSDKLNRIFSLSDVVIDWCRCVRSEGAAPEMTSIHMDYPMFLYKLELEKYQLTRDDVRIEPDVLNFTGEPGSQTFTVISPVPYTVVSDTSWITVSKDDPVVSVSVEENPSVTDARVGRVRVIFGDYYQMFVTVNQARSIARISVSPTRLEFESGYVPPEIPVLRILSAPVNIPAEGGSYTIYFRTDRTSADQITVSVPQGVTASGMNVVPDGTSSFAITVSESEQGRDLVIGLTSGVSSDSVTIKQGTSQHTPLSLAADRTDFPSSGGTMTVQVMCDSNAEWTVECDDHTEPTSGTGPGVIKVTVAASKGPFARRTLKVKTDTEEADITYDVASGGILVSINKKGTDISTEYYATISEPVSFDIYINAFARSNTGVDTNLIPLMLLSGRTESTDSMGPFGAIGHVLGVFDSMPETGQSSPNPTIINGVTFYWLF